MDRVELEEVSGECGREPFLSLRYNIVIVLAASIAFAAIAIIVVDLAGNETIKLASPTLARAVQNSQNYSAFAAIERNAIGNVGAKLKAEGRNGEKKFDGN